MEDIIAGVVLVIVVLVFSLIMNYKIKKHDNQGKKNESNRNS